MITIGLMMVFGVIGYFVNDWIYEHNRKTGGK